MGLFYISDNLGSDIITFETKLAEIGVILGVVLLFFLKCDLYLHFQDQMMTLFVSLGVQHSGENLAKIGRII